MLNIPSQTAPQSNTSKLAEQAKIVAATAHMLRCQLTVARGGIVSNDQQMVVGALNEMESLVSDLEKRSQGWGLTKSLE